MTRTFNTRMVFRTMGALLLIEAVFMAMALGVSLWYNEADNDVFLLSTIVTLLAGVVGLLVGRRAESRMGEREGYVIVAMVWVVFSAFGLLPYYLSGQVGSFTDAWFESMSGFTTTGATIIPDLEVITHGLLFWRSLTQWIGGMGIIVLSIAILPIFGLNGMQLYAAEVSGLTYEKVSPRISDTAKMMWSIYVLLTVSEVVALWLCGMDVFDAVCHSFSTIATGGFSTHNNSLEFYDSAAIHYTVTLFMFVEAIKQVLSHALLAFGYSMLTSVSNIAFNLVFRVLWMQLVYPQNPVFSTIPLCFTISWILNMTFYAIFFFFVYLRYTKKGIRKKI